ncbi:apolipoprotein N-acyltransferase, partial [Streptomyces sp. SID11233]|nr:apolipoprotein N-acyltransferase [Streptomyces sp. SID11233]
LPLAALGGTPVLGFAVVLCGFGLYAAGRALYERRARGVLPRTAALTAGVAVLLPLAGAFASRALVSDEAEAGTARVALIQGNVPQAGLEFNAQRRAVLDYHVKETKRLAERVDRGEVKRPDFVLWPENS